MVINRDLSILRPSYGAILLIDRLDYQNRKNHRRNGKARETQSGVPAQASKIPIDPFRAGFTRGSYGN